MDKIETTNLGALKPPRGVSKVARSSANIKGLQFVAKRVAGEVVREWHHRYTRFDSTRTSQLIGRYPDVDYDEAVAVVTENKVLLKNDIDPIEQSRVKKRQKVKQQMLMGAAVEPRYRFSAIASEFLLFSEKSCKPSTVTKYRSTLNNHLLPSYAGSDIRYLNIAEYKEHIFSMAIKSPSAAGQAHRTLRAMFSYAVDKGVLEVNPLLGMKSLVKATKVAPRERYLSSRELHDFLNGIDEKASSPEVAVALKIQLHTGLRIGEILAIEWAHINFKSRLITHASVEMKSGKPAETIMSDSVRRILLEHKRDHFIGERVFSIGLNTSVIGDRIIPLRKWISFNTHDLRRTTRTHLQALGCPEDLRLMITNHTAPGGVSKHYDLSKSQKAQLHWLTLWAEKLAEVKTNPAALDDGIDVDENDSLLAEFGELL